MYNYRIQRAIAVKRYDLIVNTIRIHTSTVKHEVQSFANSMVNKGYLIHDNNQKIKLRKQGLYV